MKAFIIKKYSKLFTKLGLLLLLCTGCDNMKSNAPLRTKIKEIIALNNASLGVSIIGNKGLDTLSINGDLHFPMQSVFKFHIALAVLSEVDSGSLSMDQTINIEKDVLLPRNFWSPLRDDHPNGGVFTLKKLLYYTIVKSDNTACDLLIDLVGNPNTVEKFIKKRGIKALQIRHNEAGLQAKWSNIFENWTSPKAASKTVQLFFENKEKLLSKSSYDFFWNTAKETTTGKSSIRGLLPKGTEVAHKTGWSGTHKETGITEAVNDIGIVFLPDGNYFVISVFVTASKEDYNTNASIIANIAKATYDFYTTQN